LAIDVGTMAPADVVALVPQRKGMSARVKSVLIDISRES
jgi:hypothetical protein